MMGFNGFHKNEIVRKSMPAKLYPEPKLRPSYIFQFIQIDLSQQG